MKMNDIAFDNYFSRTLYTEGKPVPSHDELIEMEHKFMEVLGREKKERSTSSSYRYLYSVNGKQVISRIGFCLRMIDEGKDTPEIRTLLSSYTRLRESLKSLDRTLYERELRNVIQKGKKGRKKPVKQQETTQVDKQPVEVPPQQPQQSKEPLKVISGTSGLAKHLGCSRSHAFGIIKSGVLLDAAKDIPIQYRVGKEWKFNREELDKYLVNHPELLKNVKKK